MIETNIYGVIEVVISGMFGSFLVRCAERMK
jgi:hypothetical protein